MPEAANDIVLNSAIDVRTNFIIVRVGNDDRPASKEDLANVEEELRKIIASNGAFNGLVSHHAIDIIQVALPPQEQLPGRPIGIFKYGTDERPVTDEEIEELQQRIANLTDEFPFLVVGTRLTVEVCFLPRKSIIPAPAQILVPGAPPMYGMVGR